MLLVWLPGSTRGGGGARRAHRAVSCGRSVAGRSRGGAGSTRGEHGAAAVRPPLVPTRPCLPPPARSHNEIDEPMFTQPIMYQAIKRHKNALQVYQEKLLKDGSISKDQVWYCGGTAAPPAWFVRGKGDSRLRAPPLALLHRARHLLPAHRCAEHTRPAVALQIRQIADKVQKQLHDAFEGAKEYKPKKVGRAGWQAGGAACALRAGRSAGLGVADGARQWCREEEGSGTVLHYSHCVRGCMLGRHLRLARLPDAAHPRRMPAPRPRAPQGDWLSSYWAGFMSPHQHSRIRNTGVPVELLRVRAPRARGAGPGACSVWYL